MKKNTTSEPLFLEIKRTFNTTPERLWKAWTEQKELQQWFCSHNYTVTHVAIDLCVGGAWRSGMRSPNGEEFVMQGIYTEVKPYTRLVMTHAWEQGEEGCKTGHETLITLTLAPQGNKTQMIFRQENFDSIDSRDDHEEGWLEFVDSLEKMTK